MRGQTADNIVRHSERDIGIGSVRIHSQQGFRVPFRVSRQLQAFEVPSFDEADVVTQHSRGDGQGEQGFRIS